MDKKVGIVSCYFKHNYGSMLQAYATQEILNKMNIDNETINVDNNIDFKKGKQKYYITQIFNFNFIKTKFGIIKLRLDKKVNKTLGKNIAIRDKKYQEFEKKINLSEPIETYKDLSNYCKKYSDILVGSDQLWLPVNVVADYYTLNWVPDNINKISYSTSFGISTIPKKYKKLYIKFLKRINYLSVREKTGCDLIKDAINREATLVCDPTILLNKNEWNKIRENEKQVEGKYILCYFLGTNIEHRKFVERLKKETGYKIVSLNHADEYVKYSDIFADETPYDVGPSEWINLIDNAEYVCTDSFHGTVFSLLYNKKFFTFMRYQNKSKMSTNSRINSLLEIVNLQERLLSGTEDIKSVMNLEIDYGNVNEKIEDFRNKSKVFLKNALNVK